MRRHKQRGQAVILVVVAMGLLLLGAVGIAVDASQLYAQRQMAQAAADGAAQAAIMSVFDGTNTAGNGNAFGGSPFTCTPGTDVRTPCRFAHYNGFGLDSADAVYVDFPGTAPGVTLSPTDTPSLARVTVTRQVNTTLMRFIGPATQRVAAQATAAILDVVSPVPIIVMHPKMPGSFAINGNPTIQICGGPTKSIQVNSESATSITVSGQSSLIDLSKAGPKNWSGVNSCAGTGADFGDFGGPSAYPSGYNWGTDGKYAQPSSPIKDPLYDVPEPAVPLVPLLPNPANVTGGTGGCPLPSTSVCKMYKPGLYPTGILIKNEFALFQPGLYYLSAGGFHVQSNGEAHMVPCTTASEPVFGCGMVVYNAGTATGKPGDNEIFELDANAGKQPGMPNGYPYTFPDGTSCTGNCLLGSQDTGTYKGILFFQKRATPARQHSLQGGGGLVLRGTIYVTNTLATMLIPPYTNYQLLGLQGTPGSTTRVIGMIIADALSLGGNATIRMTLDPSAKLHVRQVALVR